jgi:glutamate dehydrogenase (NADP+)
VADYAREYGLTYLEGKQPWSVPVDIALPCATQNELDVDAARLLIANGVKAVAEGANMPTTIAATDLFLEAGVLFAPGKAANAGGVATSGLEMAQNAARLAGRRRKWMPVCITSCWIFTTPALNTAAKRGRPTTSAAPISPVSSKWPMPCWRRASFKTSRFPAAVP